MPASPPAELDFATHGTVDVLGTAIEVFTAGTGQPLLFLHGLDGVEGAAPAIRELAKHYAVHAPSHPGFGESARPANLDRVDDLGYFYLDLLTALGLDRPVVLGTSFGGWVAAEMLTKEPARADALVLVSPLGLPGADRREQSLADIFMMARQDLNRRIGLDDTPVTELDDDRLRREMRRDEALSLYGWTPYMHNPKLAARLHRISCPTLVVWGEEDAIVTPAYRRQFALALPDAGVRMVAGAGHAVHSEQPVELAALVAGFARPACLAQGDHA